MIGIYKITNKKNKKIYIGQSNNIERRFQEHQSKGKTSKIPLDAAIAKYGKDSFTYEILEECLIEKLNDREEYWINKFQANKKNIGYNCNPGGKQATIGSNNGNSKLIETDVINIRIAYNSHKRQKEVYTKYKNKISFSYFQLVWQGKAWPHIMPEVFTEENKNYYKYSATNGEKGLDATLTDKEVLSLRKKYVSETATNLFVEYKNKMSFQTFQQILWGRSYRHLPIYSKIKKQWYINNKPVSTIP